MDHVLALGALQDLGAALGEQSVDVADVVDLDAVLEDPVRVGDVIRLVEEHGTRLAELVEPQEGAQRGHQQGPGPPPEHAARHRRHQPVTQLRAWAHGAGHFSMLRVGTSRTASAASRWATAGTSIAI